MFRDSQADNDRQCKIGQDLALWFLNHLVEIIEPKVVPCLEVSDSSFASLPHQIVDDGEVCRV